MVKIKNTVRLLLVLLSIKLTHAQSLLFPSNFFYDTYNQVISIRDTNKRHPIHTSFSPIQSNLFDKEDSIRYCRPAYLKAVRNLFYEDLIHVDYMDKQNENPIRFRFNVAPILTYCRGYSMEERDSNSISINTRGLRIKGSLGKRFKLESAFFENQSFFPDYFTKQYKALGIVPGEGRWKQFNNIGFDYASASAVASFDVNKNLNLQLGHGKNKSGYGYRSLLLSDNAFNYPYLKITSRFLKGKIQYTNLYAILTNLSTGGTKTPKGTERLYQKKPAAFQELSFAFSRHFQFSVFQGIIWKASDNKNKLVMDPQFFNPVIFSNLAFYGFDSTKNIYTGASVTINLLKRINLYGQIMIDDPAKNKMAWQTGVRYQDLLMKKLAVMLFAEYNHANPFTYTQRNSDQNIVQYNQALAHPLGANFNELCGGIALHYQRLSLNARTSQSTQRNNFGNNILASDYYNPSILYSDNFTLSQVYDARVEACVNYSWKLYLSAGYFYRQSIYTSNSVQTGSSFTQFVYLGLRTNINNFYSDY